MRALFAVFIDGTDVTSRFEPHVISISVSDRSEASSDAATITLDDTGGRLVMPQPGASVSIFLGWEGAGVGQVFKGIVDDVRASGSRSGRTLSVSAKGMDARGKSKEPQRRHFDDTTIGEAMKKAGEAAGFSVSVDEALAKLPRKYLALDDESFAAFGERIAREVGGTFKMVGDRAILARRNGGASAGGEALPAVTATWGANLHSYDISPILGRPVEKKTGVRFYDPKSATWKIEEAETGIEDATTEKVSVYAAADQDTAKDRANSDAEESDRKKGGGSVTIEGDIAAQPEGRCIVSGCRPGIDGAYRIEGVDHDYSRSGFTTKLELRQPEDGAGSDSRGA